MPEQVTLMVTFLLLSLYFVTDERLIIIGTFLAINFSRKAYSPVDNE